MFSIASIRSCFEFIVARLNSLTKKYSKCRLSTCCISVKPAAFVYNLFKMRSMTQLVGVALMPSQVQMALPCRCSTTALMSGSCT